MENASEGQYKAHVFVCTNTRKSGESCGAKNAETLRKVLKEWARENPAWQKRIRINASGCLDRCNEGVVIAVYPQNRWFTYFADTDLEQLKLEIEKIMAE